MRNEWLWLWSMGGCFWGNTPQSMSCKKVVILYWPWLSPEARGLAICYWPYMTTRLPRIFVAGSSSRRICWFMKTSWAIWVRTHTGNLPIAPAFMVDSDDPSQWTRRQQRKISHVLVYVPETIHLLSCWLRSKLEQHSRCNERRLCAGGLCCIGGCPTCRSDSRPWPGQVPWKKYMKLEERINAEYKLDLPASVVDVIIKKYRQLNEHYLCYLL